MFLTGGLDGELGAVYEMQALAVSLAQQEGPP